MRWVICALGAKPSAGVLRPPVRAAVEFSWVAAGMQRELCRKECYGFMHVRDRLSKTSEDIQAEAEAC